MRPVDVRVDEAMWAEIRAHLIRAGSDIEEAAFLFAKYAEEGTAPGFQVVDWQPLGDDCFVTRSAYYLEVAPEAFSQAIKRAHDMGACLIEAHSHPGQLKPAFSWSDVAGFEEVVPHALWRLGKRPYAALVLGADGFDGVAWTDGAFANRRPVGSVITPAAQVRATGLSHSRWEEIHARRPV